MICRVRIARTDARITHVRLSAASLAATIDGTAFVGARAELLGSGSAYQVQEVGPGGEVDFALPEGLPSRAVLMVSRNGAWCDYRHLDAPYRIGRPDFSWESDGATQLEALIASGEGVTLEFKSEVPRSGDSGRNTMKTVAAFANGDGGTIVFGVANDGTMLGVPDAAAAADRLSQLVRSNIDAQPP